MKKKGWISLAALTLVLCCAIGGTLAWLTDRTDPVTNTFTIGDINITLEETPAEYKMVPGNEISKDPTVTVKGGSEACWLFVLVEKSENFDEFLTYEMADCWTALEGAEGLYWRKVEASGADQAFAVLKDNKVTVPDTVTKEMLTAEDFVSPTLTFTAYAVQQDNIAGAAEAWAKASF